MEVFHSKGALHQRLQEKDLTADYPVAWAIGSGTVGRSFLIDVDGHLFQTPASFYTRRSEWDVSPGYEKEKILDFNRSISADCLFCHAGSIRKTERAVELVPLSCERCHGASENHRAHPFPGSIVNPAKLPARARDSVCEQCHLEGAAAILNPGKYWWDFQPGQNLEETETHYVYRRPPIDAVSHAEQLAASACLRGSNGKLWCGTCHDPHAEPADRQLQMRNICQSCHPTSQLASTHQPSQADCVACHMPRRPAADISHAAVTDHRIRRRPDTGTPAGDFSLTAWQPAPPQFERRNLALALFRVAKRRPAGDTFVAAFKALSEIPASGTDAEVFAAKGYLLLGSGQPQPALRFFRNALEQNGQSAEYWLDLAVAQEAAGDNAESLTSFRKSITAGPYDYRPYMAMRELYRRMGKANEAGALTQEFLKLVPQSIVMRLP